MDIDRFAAILEEQAALLPAAVMQRLNLGIGVVPGARRDRRAEPGARLYTLGEYHRHPVMGRGIVLYYGSFQKVFPHLMENEPRLRAEIDRVLRHELTHHLESQAGSRELEIEDARRLAEYKSRAFPEKNPHH